MTASYFHHPSRLFKVILPPPACICRIYLRGSLPTGVYRYMFFNHREVTTWLQRHTDFRWIWPAVYHLQLTLVCIKLWRELKFLFWIIYFWASPCKESANIVILLIIIIIFFLVRANSLYLINYEFLERHTSARLDSACHNEIDRQREDLGRQKKKLSLAYFSKLCLPYWMTYPWFKIVIIRCRAF